MISLDGVTLDNDLLWVNEFDTPVISQNILRTILGNTVIQSMPLIKGRYISLVASNTGGTYSGSFTREQIIAFRELEKNTNSVVLVYETETFNVIVPSGGIQVTPLIPRPNQENKDLYTGTLTLIEI